MEYDRRQAGTPVNRLHEAETYLHQAGREIERTEAIIRGLFSELSLIAKHTHDQKLRTNYEYALELKERTEKLVKDLKALSEAYNEAAREFR